MARALCRPEEVVVSVMRLAAPWAPRSVRAQEPLDEHLLMGCGSALSDERMSSQD